MENSISDSLDLAQKQVLGFIYGYLVLERTTTNLVVWAQHMEAYKNLYKCLNAQVWSNAPSSHMGGGQGKQDDSAVADHVTRLKLKLLEKKLENEHENLDDFESPFSAARNLDGHDTALQNALRRRKDLLQQLREQKLLEDFSIPHGLPSIQRKCYRPEPEHVYQIPLPLPLPPPTPLPEQPRIIQQTLPQQPATIIQQIPQQQPPLITQIPPPQPFPAPRSGSIKEDMVEMMLMQNAQMHQIIMQNMMLKSLPPPAYPAATGPGVPMLHNGQQFAAPLVVRADRSRPSTVHHHHYTSTGVPTIPSQLGFPMWHSVMSPGLGTQLGGFPSDVHHLPIPATATHTVPTNGFLGLPQGL
ncbi:uncharacterized protein C21orf58 homolog [Hemicordylus capensis]|uniref:uncharacterized protein C21orf58 homolog n=1 Tax=Hemicordylus capensis TaxID=884348 RepID=UPI002302B90F|nr:uncharacterized protein C21orf58 homolog [Hemicordylus capensis]